MRKYVGMILLMVSTVALIWLLCLDIRYMSYSECVINEAHYDELISERIELEGLVDNIAFDDQILFYEPNTETYYYSLVEGSSSAYNPKVSAASEMEPVTILFLEDEITDEVIAQNYTIRMLACSKSYYYEYQLKCTKLPIMNVEVKEDIERVEVPMTMSLFDNQKGAVKRTISSAGTIKVRGASSSRLPKVSYRMSLTTESLGENTRTNQVSLLGMRQDDDWILYTPFNDQEKVRNVFSTNLWTETCGTNNELGIQTGIEYKYFELFINSEYWGLYALGYPIDEKLMGVDEEKGEILYKKVGWGSESAFTVGRNITNGEFVNGFEVKTLDVNDSNDIYRKWTTLLSYYKQYYQYRHDNEKLLEMIDIDNAIDTYLFVGLIQGHDNTRRTEVRNMYLYMYDNEGILKILYAPWDMDLTWGNFFSEDTNLNNVSTYYLSPEDALIMTAGPLNQLLLNEAPGVLEKIFARYWELRDDAWSDEKIYALLNEYEKEIYSSGAYRRELERWPQTAQVDPDAGLSIFKAYVLARLKVMDEYYRALEVDYESGEYQLILSPDYTFSVSPVGCTDLKLYLTMLAFADYDVSVEIRDMAIWEDSFYVELFETVGIQAEEIMTNPEMESDVHIILMDRETIEIVDNAYFSL